MMKSWLEKWIFRAFKDSFMQLFGGFQVVTSLPAPLWWLEQHWHWPRVSEVSQVKFSSLRHFLNKQSSHFHVFTEFMMFCAWSHIAVIYIFFMNYQSEVNKTWLWGKRLKKTSMAGHWISASTVWITQHLLYMDRDQSASELRLSKVNTQLGQHLLIIFIINSMRVNSIYCQEIYNIQIQ